MDDGKLDAFGQTIVSALRWRCHRPFGGVQPAHHRREAEKIVEVAKYLRDDPACRFVNFTDVTAVDYPGREKRFDVVYHLLSPTLNARIRVRAEADETTQVPSIIDVFPGADWFERETYDLYGVIFTGHPDMRRILTDYGFDGHPLRKDFRSPALSRCATTTTGADNTANGTATLVNNSIGGNNTAVGSFALNSNSTAFNNTAVGAGALRSNTTGQSNTAIGVGALTSNINGGGNTATGVFALNANDQGALNTANGLAALQSNTSGGNNTAMGAGALNFNTIGGQNTAFGHQALRNNIGGGANTGSGVNALLSNTDGDFNTAIGFNALNINTTGNNNIALGFSAGSNITGDNNIDIGSTGGGLEFGAIRIGQSGSQTTTFIAGIRGVTTGNMNAIPVLIDSVGRTWHDELVAPVQTRDQTDGHGQPSHPVAQACDV